MSKKSTPQTSKLKWFNFPQIIKPDGTPYSVKAGSLEEANELSQIYQESIKPQS